MLRPEVYKLIDGERDYQDSFIANPNNNRSEGGEPYAKRTVGEFLVMLDSYLRRAKDGWTNNAGNEQALDNIRKIAGIAVHCMEKHGAPERKL
jgi:hypothetical protein